MALRCSARTLAAVALLSLAVIGILLLVVPLRHAEAPAEHMYGIVLDAGSSHTSMYVYKWPAGKENGTGIVTEHSKCHVKGKGISSYAGLPPGDAAKSLKECLDQAMRDIPKSRHAQTPLYLGATAGMRLLKINNAKETDRILKEVENKLRSYPFDFKEASILSGQHEGVYGWVTVNYLQENFAKYGFVGRWLNPGKKTTGALDLGGASTQITFKTSDEIEVADNLMELKLYGQSYRLYTQSFLCYGQDQFLTKMLAYLIKSQGVGPRLLHPCYPRFYNMSVKLGADIFDSPCANSYKLEHYDPDMSILVVGTGDYHECQDTVKHMFNFKNCSHSKCSFNGVFQPSVRGNFMGFSALFFTLRYVISLTNASIVSPMEMEAAVQQVCNMTISEMTEKTKEPERFMRNVCVISLYIKVLLMQGYGFDDLSFPTISFQEKVEGTSVGWALGYMLTLSNMVPAESVGPLKALPPGPWGGILFLFIVLLIVAMAFLLVSHFKTESN